MFVTLDIKDSRRSIGKNGRRYLSEEKRSARRRGRARLKASDYRTGFEGHISPVMTAYHIT